MLTATSPGVITPIPSAPQALSAPPAATGVPAGRPVASAASAVTSPMTSDDSWTGGSQSRGMRRASSIGSDQERRLTSKRSVPEASEVSVERLPVIRRFM